jgi:ankyrin repeat protein
MKMSGLKAMALASALALAPTLAVAGPLHDAARAGEVFTVYLILNAGGEVDELDTTGQTPLMSAALAGQEETLNQLLARGADAMARDDRGMLALHAAAYSGDAGIVSILLGNGPFPAADLSTINDADNELGVTPLIVAAEENWGDVVAYLINAGADLEITDHRGHTALARAAYHGHDEIIAMLLQAGASCRKIDPLWLKDCTVRKAAIGFDAEKR